MTSLRRPGQREMSTADLNHWFVLALVVVIGGLVRFWPLGDSGYPLNDGGLFARMASDLAENGFLLPTYTTYNGADIPFAYPPLGIYLAALLSLLTGGDTTSVVRWLPAVLSTATILAMYVMGADLLRSRWRGVVAAAAFALMPRAYLWLIVGGGVTRALGLLLALLALQQGIRMLRTHRSRHVIATAVLGGLTLLSHPQAAVFLAVSLLTLLAFHAFRGRGRTAIAQLALAGLGGLLVAAPWMVAVAAAHGIGPVLSAGRTAVEPTIGAGQLLGLSFADTAVLDLMTALGVVGVIVRIARRQWMIPVWLVLTVLADPRAGSTYATVPLALSVVPILGELLQRMIPQQGGPGTLDTEPLPRLVRTHRAASMVVVLLLFVALRASARSAVDEAGPLHGLQPDHAAAMRWVASESGEGAAFAVVSGHSWEADYLSEWFPVLANRTSIATVQGSEWTGIDGFLDRLAMYRQLQGCAVATTTCLESWADGWDLDEVYVFLPKGRLFGPDSQADCCTALRETLRASPNYRLIYEGPGASIYAPSDRQAAVSDLRASTSR